MTDKKKPARDRLRIVDSSPDLEALYAERSYALVGDNKFVPLIPRHLDDGLLRELYHKKVTKLVLGGRAFIDLCDTCANALGCLQKGMGTDKNFKCMATRRSVGLEKRDARPQQAE